MDLRLLAERPHETMGRPDHVAQLGGEGPILGQLEAMHPCDWSGAPLGWCAERRDTPVAAAIARPPTPPRMNRPCERQAGL
jgi:hypothetical protein